MNPIKVVVEIIAKNPPMALCVLGAISIISGGLSASTILIDNGWGLVGLGAFLQVLYLILRFR